MRRLYITMLTILALTLSTQSRAQGDVEYRAEIGGGAGIMGYLGDYSSSPFKNVQLAGSVMARRIFNPYSALRASATYGKIKGSSADVETFHPGDDQAFYTFNNTLVDVGVVYEQNFWPYGTGRDYRGAKRLTPYIFGGLGVTYAKADKSVFTANMPLGLGVKYKMGDRTNLSVEWALHLSLSDKLDGSPDPYGIKSSGLFKNTDCYSLFRVSFTYSFMAKCRTCHNEDE